MLAKIMINLVHREVMFRSETLVINWVYRLVSFPANSDRQLRQHMLSLNVYYLFTTDALKGFRTRTLLTIMQCHIYAIEYIECNIFIVLEVLCQNFSKIV